MYVFCGDISTARKERGNAAARSQFNKYYANYDGSTTKLNEILSRLKKREEEINKQKKQRLLRLLLLLLLPLFYCLNDELKDKKKAGRQEKIRPTKPISLKIAIGMLGCIQVIAGLSLFADGVSMVTSESVINETRVVLFVGFLTCWLFMLMLIQRISIGGSMARIIFTVFYGMFVFVVGMKNNDNVRDMLPCWAFLLIPLLPMWLPKANEWFRKVKEDS
jgi:hypothetical protein